ncbi:unnamed protein product [Rhizophagus irregularis]|nr:unnamed protein product [Rhizophagus irregularis]
MYTGCVLKLNNHNNSLFSKIIRQKQTSSNKSAFILVLFEDIINPASLKTLSLITYCEPWYLFIFVYLATSPSANVD